MSYGSQMAGALGKWGQPYKDVTKSTTSVEEEGGIKGLLAALPELLINIILMQQLGGENSGSIAGGGTISPGSRSILGRNLLSGLMGGEVMGGGGYGGSNLLSPNTMTPNMLLNLMSGITR